MEQEIEKIKEKINSYSTKEFDKVLFECGIESIEPSIESDYVQVVNRNKNLLDFKDEIRKE